MWTACWFIKAALVLLSFDSISRLTITQIKELNNFWFRQKKNIFKGENVFLFFSFFPSVKSDLSKLDLFFLHQFVEENNSGQHLKSNCFYL